MATCISDDCYGKVCDIQLYPYYIKGSFSSAASFSRWNLQANKFEINGVTKFVKLGQYLNFDTKWLTNTNECSNMSSEGLLRF